MHYKIDLPRLSETVRKVLQGAIDSIVKEEIEKANVIVGARITQAAIAMSVEVSKMNRLDKDNTELNIIITGKD